MCLLSLYPFSCRLLAFAVAVSFGLVGCFSYCVCMTVWPGCTSALHKCLVPLGAGRGCQMLCNWSYRYLQASIWVLGTEPRPLQEQQMLLPTALSSPLPRLPSLHASLSTGLSFPRLPGTPSHCFHTDCWWPAEFNDDSGEETSKLAQLRVSPGCPTVTKPTEQMQSGRTGCGVVARRVHIAGSFCFSV